MRLSVCTLAAIGLIVSGTRLWAPELTVQGETVPIYLLADTLHTGLAFDLRWLEKSGYRVPSEVSGHPFVTMSWGNETAYLQERWLTPLQVCRALFTPTPSVMECIPFDWNVEEVFPRQRVYVADVPETCGPALANFLNAHTERDRDGNAITIAPSSWGSGRLIRCPATEPYDITRMCNNWTAEALAATGVAIDPSRVLAAWDVIGPATSGRHGFHLIWHPAWKKEKARGPGSR